MTYPLLVLTLAVSLAVASTVNAADAKKLADETALLKSLEITPGQLKPLVLDTKLVEDGKAAAVICHAADPAWREAAALIQKAVAEATGVMLPMKTEAELSFEQADSQNVILLGHLDNNRHVARLYHNFFVCLDVGFTGRNGHEIRSVHDPFGTKHNYILASGSFAEGTRKAAQAFAELVRQKGSKGNLTLGRLLEVTFDAQDRASPAPRTLNEKQREDLVSTYRKVMLSPGQARTAVARLVDYGVGFRRTGDREYGLAYRDMMRALLEYYRTDEYISGDGMARYDRDFRDSWTHEVAILWDLHEESGLFSEQERLDMTNLLIRLGLECVIYQGWNRPDRLASWAKNQDIVHNHNTFPALGVLFVGNYLKRHYDAKFVDDWLAVAHGIFNGQKHSSKPQEDSAGYQWLPIIHVMMYSLATGDLTFFQEGHARDTAKVAVMVLDNAGYQAAFGDHPSLKAAAGIPAALQMVGWYHKDPELVWAARLAGRDSWFPMGQDYSVAAMPQPPLSHVGVTVSRLPRLCYDYVQRGSQYRATPNLPLEQTFDKLAIRGGWERADEYMLLDGFGRGNHMHFDANAIVSFAKGGEPLLVDGEYIKNSPKYHNSLVIIRNGQAEFAPAVTGLGRADQLDTTAFTRTWLTQYNGAEWTRHIVWRRNDYFLVMDEVRALEAGDYTLRCCWRPWGEASLKDGVLTVAHPPMQLAIANADGAASRLEALKTVDRLPISRLSQQVSVTLKAGEAYRFLNLVHAEPADKPRAASVQRLGEGLVAIGRKEGRDLVAFRPEARSLAGLAAEAEMVVLSAERVAVAGGKRMGDVLKATAPVSLELAPTAGTGVLVASADTEVTLRLKPNSPVTCGNVNATADAAGQVTLKLPAGRHALKFDLFAMYPAVTEVLTQAARLVPPSAGQAQKGLTAPALKLAWQHAGFDPLPEILPVASVKASAPHSGRYGPVEKLFDGDSSGSTASVMWEPGVTPMVIAELAVETDLRRVLLREWHMNPSWDISDRKLELSSDGFKQDVRAVPVPFVNAGEQRFGGNVNTLFEAKVGQKARQIRLTLTPARPECTVYLAEVELHGVRPGATTPITACATGDLNGDGKAEVVVGSASGGIRALTADGQPLWTFASDDRAAINCLACADVDGDGKAEVMYGTAGRLGLLGSDGKERWRAEPPKFRGLTSDVMTVFPADVNGDRKTEIVCGCASWQYFAYDAQGKMVWKNIIYAHSATVGCAADVDGDGKDEIVAGNVYYRLNLIDHDGKRLWNAGNLGPEMTAVAAADVNGDKRPEILTGVDGGNLHCYDRTGKELWVINLGDKVTRILAVDLNGDGKDEIVCSAESAHVFALNTDGRILWRTALPDGVSDLALVRGKGKALFVAAAGTAGVAVLDGDGKVLAVATTQDRANSVLLSDGRAFATTAKGAVEAFELPLR